MNEVLEAQLTLLEAQMQAFPWNSRPAYANYMAQTYYYVCHSTRLLGLAASFFQVDRNQLHRRFATHMGEEKNHEQLALNDLKNLGYSLDKLPELPSTKAFYETQYYKIERQDPTALLGYILLLEGLAARVGPSLYQQIQESHGERCGTFLKVHAEDDPNHVKSALAMIETLNSTQKQFAADNLVQTGFVFGSILHSCQESKPQLRLLKAA